MFHMKRTAGTMVLHSALPAGYILGYSWFTSVVDRQAALCSSLLTALPGRNFPGGPTQFWSASPGVWWALVAATLLPVLTASLAWLWSLKGWAGHPMVRQLQRYAGPATNWKQARDTTTVAIHLS